MTTHAKLSASSAHRWFNCPGSVRLSQGHSSPTTRNAAEGTVAHDVAATALKGVQPAQSWLGKKVIIEDKFEIEVTQEMVDHVNTYVNDVLDDRAPSDKHGVEMNLTKALTKLHPGLGGTADYWRYRVKDKHLRVRDFKYGAGVLVDVEENEQAMIYALGALLTLDLPIADVTVTIDQPRAEHPAGRSRDYTFPATRLLDFSADLVAAARATEDPQAVLVPGAKQCQWCPAKPTCPALEKQQNALMAQDFADLSALAPARLATALDFIPAVKARIKAIEELAYTRASQGETIPGHKLVDKRPTRKWKDEEALKQWASSWAISVFGDAPILSPAQMEKRLAENAPRGEKKNAGAVLAPFIESVSSGHVLVPIGDDRPLAKTIAASDFETLPTGV